MYCPRFLSPVFLHGADDRVALSTIDNYSRDPGWWEKSWIERRTNNVHGNNYVAVVGWDESDCPDAYAVKASSQSSDPDSPHFADGTELYSKGEWIDVPFCREDI